MAAIQYPPLDAGTNDPDDYTVTPWTAPNGTKWLYDVTKTRWTAYQESSGGGDVAGETVAATAKTTPVDADLVPLVDSAASNALKKLTWANLKATLKTYFDSLYQATGAVSNTAYNESTWTGVTDVAPSKNAVRDKIEQLVGAPPTTHASSHAEGGSDEITPPDIGALHETRTHLGGVSGNDVYLSSPSGYEVVPLSPSGTLDGKDSWAGSNGTVDLSIRWWAGGFWEIHAVDTTGPTDLYIASKFADTARPFELTGWGIAVGAGQPAFSTFPFYDGDAIGQRLRVGASAPYNWYAWDGSQWVFERSDAGTVDTTAGGSITTGAADVDFSTGVTVAQGGTGATTASTARTNLGAAPAIETKTTNFTAEIGGRYITEGTVTITDPSGTTAGQSYEVWIGSGTCTIGGTAYSPSRFSIRRRYNGSAWATPAPYLTDSLDFAAGAKAATRTNLGATTIGANIFTAADAAAVYVLLGRTTAYCTSSVNRSSTTTLANDPTMVIALAAATTYEWEAWLEVTSGATPGYKFAIIASAALDGVNGNNSGYSWANGGAETQYTITSSTGVGATITRTAASTNYVYKLRGTLRTLGACNLSVQWAQNTSDASNTTRHAGSYLTVRKVGP